MIYLTIFLTFLLILSGLVIYNLYSQIGQLETHVQKLHDDNATNLREFDFFYRLFLRWFTEASVEMDRVDKRGSYSSDDEVGFAFKVMRESINQTKSRLEHLQTIQEAPKEG